MHTAGQTRRISQQLSTILLTRLTNGDVFHCSCHEVVQEEEKYSSTYSYYILLGLRWSDYLTSHAPAALLLGKNPHSHCIRDWVDPRGGLDVLEKTKISLPYLLQLKLE
jgi:hypothetical protein